MARGINKVILIGNLGNDPEIRHMPSGGAVATLSVATSEAWKDKNSGELQERTEWHRVVLFNRLGEIAGEYLRKGSKVYLEGSLRTRKWQDKEGRDRYTTEIVANEMQMLDSKGGSNHAPQMDPAESEHYSDSQGITKINPKQNNASSSMNAPSTADDFDDEIPF